MLVQTLLSQLQDQVDELGRLSQKMEVDPAQLGFLTKQMNSTLMALAQAYEDEKRQKAQERDI